MKNSIKKICLLSIFLLLVSIVVIVKMGNTYTIKFNSKNLKIENIELVNDDIVKIIDKKKIENNYYIKVKAIKPGKVDIYTHYSNNFLSGYTLYVHNSMVITDNSFFGKSNCSEIIPISLSIIMIYILSILIKKYNYSKRINLFQYKNIAYLGIIIFFLFFLLNNTLSIFNYLGLSYTINKALSVTTSISFLLFPIVFITFILVTISNINLIIREGLSIRNLLGLILGIFICILTILPEYIYNLLMKLQIVNIYNLNSIGPYLYNFFEATINLSTAYLECVLIGTIIIAIKSAVKKDSYNKDYIIILGCQIKKDGTLTPLLQGRVDRALDFRNNQLKYTGKDIIFIPSGGKGDDEIISEAEAMKNYLVEHGINKKNILIEDKSKNTYENLKFSNKLIKDKKANVCFSTTNYHVLRAGLIATEQGLILDGIGSKTKAYFWVNAFIREFIGTLYAEKKKHIIVFSLILVLIAIMICINYINNIF